ncbi:MAG TPA: ABATE domain-containing protein [Actinomycetes bacterium]
MHWVMVEGYRMPILVGGHPALDFCNTWAGWGPPPHPRGEWLHDFDHLAVWAFHAGLVGAEESGRVRALGRRRPGEAAGVLEEARGLRRALYRVAQDPAARRDFQVVARLAQRSAAAAELVAGPDGQARWVLPVSLDLPLLAVARSAAELLCQPDRPPVGRCPGKDCGWLFVNRQGHRRWCTMQYCGNRAKAREHARRRRDSARTPRS